MLRNTGLDAIRGIALLGLLFLNIYYFALFETGYVNTAIISLPDKIIDWMNALLLDGRFRSLFCLSFGAALCIQMKKYKDIDRLHSRLFWLVIFGLLHGFLLWPGDILVTYGLAGYFAVKYLNASHRKLIIHALAYGGFGILMMLLLGSIDIEAPIIRGSKEYNDVIRNLPTDLLGHFIHNGSFYSIMLLITPLITLWYCLGIMLAGICCYRYRVFEIGLSTKGVSISILIVLFFSIIIAYLKTINNHSLSVLLDCVIWINAFVSALLIVHCVVRLKCKGLSLSWFEALGRFSLTGYILQSLLAVTFFYLIAPNAYEYYTRVEYLAVAFLLTLIQLFVALIYLRIFNQGPLEFILRKLCTMNKER
jgi:uncharacterized protein